MKKCKVAERPTGSEQQVMHLQAELQDNALCATAHPGACRRQRLSSGSTVDVSHVATCVTLARVLISDSFALRAAFRVRYLKTFYVFFFFACRRLLTATSVIPTDRDFLILFSVSSVLIYDNFSSDTAIWRERSR